MSTLLNCGGHRGSIWDSRSTSASERPEHRAELGWEPAYVDVIDDIRHGSDKQSYEAAKARGAVQSYSWAGHG
jgi:hypothetical protein